MSNDFNMKRPSLQKCKRPLNKITVTSMIHSKDDQQVRLLTGSEHAVYQRPPLLFRGGGLAIQIEKHIIDNSSRNNSYSSPTSLTAGKEKLGPLLGWTAKCLLKGRAACQVHLKQHVYALYQIDHPWTVILSPLQTFCF